MNPSVKQPGRGGHQDIVRWLAVLPTILLCRFVVLSITAGLYPVISQVPVLARLIRELPVAAAMVIAGSLVAPRASAIVATVLAGFWIVLSLAIHVILPENVGMANWLDAAFALAGALSGMFYIQWRKPGLWRSDAESTQD